MPKIIRLNVACYFIMKIPSESENQQVISDQLSDINFKDLMKLYKDYTKEQYLFLVNDATLLSDNSFITI